MRVLIALLMIVVAAVNGYAELRILGEESPPGEYLDSEGQPAGVTIDLLKDLMRRQNLTASIRLLPWKRAYHMGLTGKKVILLETTRTEERENRFKWAGPILVVKRVIYGRADYHATIETVADLHGAGEICVLLGSSNQDYLVHLGLTNVNPVAKPVQCLKMLHADRLDLFYTSEIGMQGLLENQNMTLDSVKAILNLKKEYLYLAFSRDISDARVASWQRALEEAKADGSVAAIYRGVYSEETIREICLPGDPLAK